MLNSKEEIPKEKNLVFGSKLSEESQETKQIQTFNSTTSFLTATTLIYTIGAGITAGAGTRLVLQSFLLKLFTV